PLERGRRGSPPRSDGRSRSRNRPDPSSRQPCRVAAARPREAPRRRLAPRAARRGGGRSSDRFVFQTEAEHRLEVVRRELLERDHRLRLLDAGELGQVLRDDLGQVLMLANPRDRDKVPLAGDRVDLRHTLDIGELRPQTCQPVARRLDQDDGGQHLSGHVAAGDPAVSPYINVSVVDAVLSEDRAYVRPVVVAVMKGLNDGHPMAHVRRTLCRGGVVWPYSADQSQQLVAAAFHLVPQRIDSRELRLLRKLRWRSTQPFYIALLGRREVQEGRG